MCKRRIRTVESWALPGVNSTKYKCEVVSVTQYTQTNSTKNAAHRFWFLTLYHQRTLVCIADMGFSIDGRPVYANVNKILAKRLHAKIFWSSCKATSFLSPFLRRLSHFVSDFYFIIISSSTNRASFFIRIRWSKCFFFVLNRGPTLNLYITLFMMNLFLRHFISSYKIYKSPDWDFRATSNTFDVLRFCKCAGLVCSPCLSMECEYLICIVNFTRTKT